VPNKDAGAVLGDVPRPVAAPFPRRFNLELLAGDLVAEEYAAERILRGELVGPGRRVGHAILARFSLGDLYRLEQMFGQFYGFVFGSENADDFVLI